MRKLPKFWGWRSGWLQGEEAFTIYINAYLLRYYPCYYTPPEGHDKGYYKPTSVCREKCCKEPACTPAGDDTPKWKATLAERMEGESPIAQPDFGQAETPDKTVLPDDYKAETGCTPPTDLAHVTYHHRLNHVRWGVPGESSDNPFCLGTPKRQKTRGD